MKSTVRVHFRIFFMLHCNNLSQHDRPSFLPSFLFLHKLISEFITSFECPRRFLWQIPNPIRQSNSTISFPNQLLDCHGPINSWADLLYNSSTPKYNHTHSSEEKHVWTPRMCLLCASDMMVDYQWSVNRWNCSLCSKTFGRGIINHSIEWDPPIFAWRHMILKT